MEEEGLVDMDSSTDQFCISWFTLQVANVGAAQAVQSWNEHPIPGMLHRFAIVYLRMIIKYLL